MPVPRHSDDQNGAIAFKFVMNPGKVSDLDELYDALDVNKGSNVKYVLIYNPRNH